MRVWNWRTSTQSNATSSGFLRFLRTFLTTPRMASAVSTRSLAQNRQARLIWCLALPSMPRPRLARETRSTRVAAATRMPSVLACDRRSETAQTETTHAIASVRRRMIDSLGLIVPGWATRARNHRGRLILCPHQKPRAKVGIRQGFQPLPPDGQAESELVGHHPADREDGQQQRQGNAADDDAHDDDHQRLDVPRQARHLLLQLVLGVARDLLHDLRELAAFLRTENHLRHRPRHQVALEQ